MPACFVNHRFNRVQTDCNWCSENYLNWAHFLRIWPKKVHVRRRRISIMRPGKMLYFSGQLFRSQSIACSQNNFIQENYYGYTTTRIGEINMYWRWNSKVTQCQDIKMLRRLLLKQNTISTHILINPLKRTYFGVVNVTPYMCLMWSNCCSKSKILLVVVRHLL